MKSSFLALIVVFLFFGCNQDKKKTERKKEQSVMVPNEDDPNMVYPKFNETLTFNNVTFKVLTSYQEDGSYELSIHPYGLADRSIKLHRIDGGVKRAKFIDMNGDGHGELMIFVFDRKYKEGDVITYSVQDGQTLRKVEFPSVLENERINVGYSGRDEFMLMGKEIGHRFPVYKDGKRTSFRRMIRYTMENGSDGPFYKIKSIESK